MRGGDLHFLVDRGRAHVERAAEDEGEAEDVVDLIRIIAAAGRDNAIGAHCLCRGRRDLGVGIGHRKNNRRRCHLLQKGGRQRVLRRQPEEDVGPVERLFEAAPVGLRRMRRLPLVHPLSASLVDDAGPVAHDDVVVPHTHRLDEFGARNCRRARAVHHHLDVTH